MKFLLPLLLFVSHLLHCSNSFEDEDPTLFHHVNVISGHLNLCFEDAVIEGGIPLTITRTYSSGGALQDSTLSDPTFDKGWTIYPHLRLYLEGSSISDKYLRGYLLEKGGVPVKYLSKKTTKHHNYLYPVPISGKSSGKIGSRKNPANNHIEIDTKEKTAILYAADGSIRHYSKDVVRSQSPGYWYLELEVLPSKHRIVYLYEDNALARVELQNPAGNQVFAAISFEAEEKAEKSYLTAKASDGKVLTYQQFSYNGRDYIEDVDSNCRPKEHYCYEGGRKGIGARVSGMQLGAKEQFTASYYLPENEKEEKKWLDKVPKKKYCADKVRMLESPVGPEGMSIPIAQFEYFADHTDVRDVDDLLIRYHHTKGQLSAIEYFDKMESLHSVVRFYWEKGNLRTKALFNASEQLLFAKSFTYEEGNIIKEQFFGNFSGELSASLKINKEGGVEGGECITKSFKYLNSLPIEEIQNDGLTYRFEYIKGTDLVTAKLTSKDGVILLREFYIYDGNNLLVEEIVDDGNTKHKESLSGVSERHFKRYERSPHNGLCLSVTDGYLDLNTGEERTLSIRAFTYTPRCEVETETIFDSNNEPRYTLETGYDSKGRVIRKTTPSGYESTYDYDSLDNLICSKEVGKLHQTIEYDIAGRPFRSTESDGNGFEKISETSYDIKGRPLVQTDFRGTSTWQKYDCFGNCQQIHFARTLDENRVPYTPVATFTHDLQGNLVSHTDPLGETTVNSYNTLRKPIRIEYPDGAVIFHRYNCNGSVSQTRHPDQTVDYYTYDAFERIRSKITCSKDNEPLSQEIWDYNAFHLLSYTNPEGLTTIYSYDGAGRKVEEKAEDRIITYSYDSLGFLERTTVDGQTQVKLHDEEGNVTKQWEEDRTGVTENLTCFFYDKENRKEKAIRITSQGEATDYFGYDEEGRLTKHTDPSGNVYRFQYEDKPKVNKLGQEVYTKATIDPLGNQTVESYDLLNRLVQIEKKSSEGQTVSNETHFYDRAGNKVKRQITVYHHHSPVKTYSTTWRYDARGRVIEEVEEDEKVTSYSYDKKGRLITKTDPNSITLTFSYDGLDRLLDLQSSDKRLHYVYTYGPGPSPVTAYDKINDLLWIRDYNIFGQLIKETSPSGATLSWDYDSRGRCKLFTLPDDSAIDYSYSDLHLATVTRLSASATPRYAHTYTQFDENGHVCQEELIHNLGVLSSHRDLLERPKEQQSPWNSAIIEYGPSSLVTKIENTLFSPKEYAYDPLDQLQQEGEQTYDFDSLGNPSHAQVNDLNQISSIGNTTLTYNRNGNPIHRYTEDQITQYTYDPLNRLTTLDRPGQVKVQFFYDPFSRLYAKTTDKTQFYLYDQDKEVGLLDQQNNILELKVLGLGVQGDIGAAIAIELNSEVYVPLHDFSGNIIAIADSQGALVETYEISAFGTESTSSAPINPWRFNSKRAEEGLIFFGSRFYDPALGRWLTPDPAGSIDSANLYLYVRNSPLNRLDLFGLDSFSMTADIRHFRPEVSFGFFNRYPRNKFSQRDRLIPAKASFGDIQVDWAISANCVHKIKPTPEEIRSGTVVISNHFHELLPSEGQFIALTSFQNGVQTEHLGAKQFEGMCYSVMDKLSEDHLFIGIYNPKKPLYNDLNKTSRERQNKDTPSSILLRQFLIAVTEAYQKINPDLLLLHNVHSRGGATFYCAWNGMTPEQQDLMRKHVYFLGAAPAMPMSFKQVFVAYNFYSENDWVTKRYAKEVLNGPNCADYTIQFLKNPSNFGKDHAFLGITLQNELKSQLKRIGDQFDFYEQKR